jgi:hypothetical protein
MTKLDHVPVTFNRFHGSLALLSIIPPRSAVVFVHGFDGDPTKTWVDFHGMMRIDGNQIQTWRDRDLFFYSYISRDQIPSLAEDFLDFLTSIAKVKAQDHIDSEFSLPSSEEYVLGAAADIARFRGSGSYESIVLVGHSTGAVVIRKALEDWISPLLKTHPDPTKWKAGDSKAEVASSDLLLASASLRFFAPAHLGFLGAGALGVAMNVPVIDRFIGIHLKSKPLFHNLEHDCPILMDLRKNTERLYKEHRLNAFKATVLFGKHEEIVYQGGYDHDDVLTKIPNHNHTSICKPRIDYLKPMDFVSASSASANNA